MNDTVGKNYIAVKGRDTLRKIVVVSPRVVLTECEYKELGWRYELWPSEPSETWLNFSYSDERLKDVNSKMLLMSNLLRVQLETEKQENEMRLKEINKTLELIALGMEAEQNKLLGVSENGKDLCISCGEESDYSYDTHIDYRVGYVEGAGQLCKACYANVDKEL